MAEGDLDLEISAGAVSPEAEESSFWEKLPRELQNKVLSYLPLPILFQAQCVCKPWRDVILHPDFAKLYDATHSSDPPSTAMFYRTPSRSLHPCLSHLVLPRRIEWSAYDYAHRTWKRRTSLPRELATDDREHYSVYPVEGLVVCRFWNCGVSNWVVWNPLTNNWTALPPCKTKTLTPTSVFVHAFVADESSKQYKILVAHYCQGSNGRLFNTSTRLVTEVYDSATLVWTQSEATFQHPLNPLEFYGANISNIQISGVLCNDVIYFVSGHAHDYVKPSVLLCYDIKREEWHEEVTVDACKSVFEWDGRLMSAMVHRLDHEEEDGSRWKRVVFEWDLATRSWVDTGIQLGGDWSLPWRIVSVMGEIAASGNHLVLAGFVRNSFRVSVYKKAENCWMHSLRMSFETGFSIHDKMGARLVQFKPRLGWTP